MSGYFKHRQCVYVFGLSRSFIDTVSIKGTCVLYRNNSTGHQIALAKSLDVAPMTVSRWSMTGANAAACHGATAAVIRAAAVVSKDCKIVFPRSQKLISVMRGALLKR